MKVFNGTRVEHIYKLIEKDFSLGLPPHQIAQNYGIRYKEVVFVLANWGHYKQSLLHGLLEEELLNILQLRKVGVSARDISKLYKIDRHALGRLLQRYGFKDTGPNKNKALRSTTLTEQQKQLVLGTLLGDGGLWKGGPNKNAKYHMVHSVKQREYFFYKYKILQPFALDYLKTKAYLPETNKNYWELRCGTMRHPGFNYFYDMFYGNGKKLPANLYNWLNPYVLALWYMDDGSKSTYGCIFCTLNFTYNEHLFMIDVLKKKFDLNASIGQYNRPTGIFYRLDLHKKETDKLFNIIKPYILPSMEYKLGL